MVTFSFMVAISLVGFAVRMDDLSHFQLSGQLLGILGLSQAVYIAGKLVAPPAMSDLEAFYLPLGDGRYEPTRATESPWDRTAQHGGPPAALLAELIDATVEGELRLARLSIDFFGAIPRKPLMVRVELQNEPSFCAKRSLILLKAEPESHGGTKRHES